MDTAELLDGALEDEDIDADDVAEELELARLLELLGFTAEELELSSGSSSLDSLELEAGGSGLLLLEGGTTIVLLELE